MPLRDNVSFETSESEIMELPVENQEGIGGIARGIVDGIAELRKKIS